MATLLHGCHCCTAAYSLDRARLHDMILVPHKYLLVPDKYDRQYDRQTSRQYDRLTSMIDIDGASQVS